jgi:hypothetical protein
MIYQVMHGCAQLDVTHEAIALSQSNSAQALMCLMNLLFINNQIGAVHIDPTS